MRTVTFVDSNVILHSVIAAFNTIFTFSLQESDLLSAILLEQAAHCFLRTQPPRIRKYAFNMILAGHRYSKAAQVGRLRM